MGLKTDNTKWVLFLSSSGEPEERHIMDLAFGLHCLETAGIKKSDIFLYIDGKNRQMISKFISHGTNKQYSIKHSIDFFSDQKSNVHDNLVLFVTGHGGLDGIDAPQPITPYALLRCIKATPNLKQAITYLGQCYAGIFNYTKVAGSETEPEVIMIGATNLHASLSVPTQESFPKGDIPWVANLFLLHIFKWITNPIDVDGDGKETIIDAYKYAGSLSNDKNKDIKAESFMMSFDLHEELKNANEAYKKTRSLIDKLILKAIKTKYMNQLSIRYNHQECWILNSIPAQSIEI